MASPVTVAKNKHIADGFTEVFDRGKGWLKSRNPGTDQFALTSQVGNRGWHFGAAPFDETNEVDTAWTVGDSAPYRRKMILADYHAYAGLDDDINFDAGQIVQYVDPGSGESISFQPQQLQWTNNLDQIEAIGDPGEVAAVVDGDVLRWVGAYGSDLDFEWETQTARLTKKLIIQNSAAIGTPAQYILDGGDPVLNLQFIFQRSSGVRAWVDGVAFDEKNNSELTTANNIEFRLESTGAVVWYLTVPKVWDSKDEWENSGAITQVRGTPQNLFVSVRVPWSWLETATYPVVVDPTVEEQVSASADDGQETPTGVIGALDATTTRVSDNTGIWLGLFRFLDVTISDGATIDTSYFSGYFYNGSVDDVNTEIYAQDSSTPATITTAADDISDRTKTTAHVNWTDTSLSVGWENSPSLNTVLQELVDSYDYSSGLDLALIFVSNASSTQDGIIRTYDHDTANGGKIYIEYTVSIGDLQILETDNITIGENVTVSIGDLQILETDNITIADVDAVALDDLSISETDDIVIGDIDAETLISIIIETDNITIGDVDAVELDDLSISETDDITLADTIADLTISEAGAFSINETDDIAIGESVSVVLGDLTISASDGITIGDVDTVVIEVEGEHNVNESDGITFGESVTVSISDLVIGESDNITIVDSPTVSVSAIGDTSVSEDDNLVIGESVSVSISDLQIAEADNITVGDAPTVSIEVVGDRSISVSDGLTIGESVSASLPDALAISVTDGLAIGETVALALLVAVIEGWTLYPRSTAFELDTRDIEFELDDRSTAWTIEER